MKKSIVLLSAAMAVLVSGCTKTEDHLKELFKNHSQLIDPDSVQIRNLTRGELGSLRRWCGDVNAKNRMGGYVGWQPFIISINGSDVTVFIGEEDESFRNLMCESSKKAPKSLFPWQK